MTQLDMKHYKSVQPEYNPDRDSSDIMLHSTNITSGIYVPTEQ